MNSIRDYLIDAAARITDGAGRRFASAGALRAAQATMRTEYLEMMGIVDLPTPEKRPPLEATITARTEQPSFVIERLHYQSLPGLYVTANLYVPRRLNAPAPAVLYVCGHSSEGKAAGEFQSHLRRWAELGFVALIVDTVQFNEVQGHHHGCYAKGWFNWYSRGYTPAGVELLNGVRGLDLLVSRPEVDPARLGVTGISGGGGASWWIAAADERVRAAAPVCGTGTLRSHVAQRTVDGHCDCMYFINYRQWDLADLGALIAPRALLIGTADRDAIFSIASVRECYERARTAYELLGAPDNIRLVEGPGPHSYPPVVTRSIFSWFLNHLGGREVAAEDLPDTDPSPNLAAERLSVYSGSPPRSERSATIHDSFVALAKEPDIRTAADLRRHRDGVVAALRARAFAHFPKPACALDAEVEYEYRDNAMVGKRLGFTSEAGWRLHARLVSFEALAGKKAPVLLHVSGPSLPERPPAKWLSGRADYLWSKFDACWHRMDFEPRGIGETSWGPDLDWHVRRAAAITGRTVASMRVYDMLRAIEVARAQPESNGAVALLAEGEMAAAALYAALLDGRVRGVALGEPPATQDAPSSPDGAGPAIEMLGVLRFADLAVVAGLLYPAELVFLYSRPPTYAWAEELYARLGAPGRVVHVRSLADWRPEPTAKETALT